MGIFRVGEKAKVIQEGDGYDGEFSWVGCIVTIERVNEGGVPYDYFVKRTTRDGAGWTFTARAYYDDYMLTSVDQSTPVCERCAFEIENGVCVGCGWDNGALASQTEVRTEKLKVDYDALAAAHEVLLNSYKGIQESYRELVQAYGYLEEERNHLRVRLGLPIHHKTDLKMLLDPSWHKKD